MRRLLLKYFNSPHEIEQRRFTAVPWNGQLLRLRGIND